MHNNDVSTGLIYYHKILELDSNNYLALSNIGSILAKSGKDEEAALFFEKSLKIRPNFPNAILSLGIISYNKGEFLQSFEYSTKGLKQLQFTDHLNEDLNSQLENLLVSAAKGYQQEANEERLYLPFMKRLESRSKLPIIISEDEDITSWAKLEVGEYHHRNHHKIIINKKKDGGYSYYVFHELKHLEYILDARENQENEIFSSDERTYEKFKNRVIKDGKFKNLKSVLGDKVEGLIKKLYQGLNLQIYNAPIDVFIESDLYKEFPELRPLQFLGLLNMHREAIQGANDQGIKERFPSFIRDANITLTLTQIYLFRDLFGYDLTSEITEKRLHSKAQSLYDQFLEMKDDKAPAEEYDLIRWWAEDLGLIPYFKLEKEVLLDDQLTAIESDQFNLESSSLQEEEQMQKFFASHKQSGLNMAVVFHMQSAKAYFKTISKSKIREIATEIALLGRSGIDPYSEETYNLSSVPGKEFSGWKLLAWMYCAWMEVDKGVARELGLDFGREYGIRF